MPETRWITVFEGAATEAAVLRGLLETEGIECFVPDELTKLVDPFITGPNPFQVRLQVTEADLPRARALLTADAEGAAARVAGRAAGIAQDDDDDEEEEESEAAQAASALDGAALRTILLTVLLVTAPLAIPSFLFYARDCRRLGSRSRLHVGAVLACLLALAIVGAAVLHLTRSDPGPAGFPQAPPEPRRSRPASPIGPR